MALNAPKQAAELQKLKYLVLVMSLLLAHSISARESVSATIAVRVNLAPAADFSTNEVSRACDFASLAKRRDRRTCQNYQIDTEEDDHHVHLTVRPI